MIEALDRLSTRLAWTQRDAEGWWTAFREAKAAEDAKSAPAAKA